MAIKPWYKVVTPREDLREGRPLDAAEFAVHLDHVRDGRAAVDYQDPERFFDRTYLTKSLILLASQVIRRLSGEVTETSAVFNMATQFGGGKTHAADPALPPGQARTAGPDGRASRRCSGPRGSVRYRRRPRRCSWAPSSIPSGGAAATTAPRNGRRPGARSPSNSAARRPSRWWPTRRGGHGPGGRRDPRFPAQGSARAHPDGRVDELREPQPQERACRLSSTTSCTTCRRRPVGSAIASWWCRSRPPSWR